MIKAWPENASTEPSVIKRWWAQWPKANVGIVCGKESGIFAVDVDGYEGLTELHRLDALHGSDDSPITPRSKTGGGGTHILFQHEPGLKNEVRFAPGLDIRTDGGLIVAPPSIHQSGTLYEWDALADPSEVPVAECPRWLLQIIRASAIKSTAAVVRDAEVIPQGTRDRTLTSLAGSMRRVGMTEPEIYAGLRQINQDRCQPPLPQESLQRISRSISQYPPAPETVEITVGKNGKDNGHQALVDDEDEGLWEGPEFESADFPEPEWLAKGLIPKAMLSMIVADPKVGKSVMAHGLCIAAAIGGFWLGERVPETRCLYINWEDPPGLTRERARKQMEGRPLPKGYFIREPPFGKSLTEMSPWIVRKIKQLNLGLLVVDPLAIAARWKDETNPYETGVIMSGLQEIAVKCNIAVVVVHHSTKSGGEWGKEVRGSGGIFGAVMSLLSIKRRADGIFDLDLINKLTGDRKSSLQRNTKTLSWVITERVDAEGNPMSGVQIQREENMELVLATIREAPSVTIGELAATTEFAENTVRRYVKQLIREKLVVEGDTMAVGPQGGRPSTGYWAVPQIAPD